MTTFGVYVVGFTFAPTPASVALAVALGEVAGRVVELAEAQAASMVGTRQAWGGEGV